MYISYKKGVRFCFHICCLHKLLNEPYTHLFLDPNDEYIVKLTMKLFLHLLKTQIGPISQVYWSTAF